MVVKISNDKPNWVEEFLEYYNHERPHSGLDGNMINPLSVDRNMI
ncbi:MAG: transposase [Lentisphaerae bacterium]|nr:transposase [Lentisphaerota bacterium]